MAAQKGSGCETSRWNVDGEEFPGVRHPDGNGGEGFPCVRHLDGMAAEKDSGCETPGWKWRRRRISCVRHPDGKAAKRDSVCETPRWKGGGEEFRMCNIRIR
ncbi:hypothetical protein VitviT2T_004549 [Vitis vinifera]|uniref:Uncharacterized protein n=1 Tax=Vitis vinifera TaxID=29760 RepID=A0ABY9BQX2_VITVI|nr:hypothetical protein VitviT2T_004549 [Vitis vinifera]